MSGTTLSLIHVIQLIIRCQGASQELFDWDPKCTDSLFITHKPPLPQMEHTRQIHTSSAIMTTMDPEADGFPKAISSDDSWTSPKIAPQDAVAAVGLDLMDQEIPREMHCIDDSEGATEIQSSYLAEGAKHHIRAFSHSLLEMIQNVKGDIIPFMEMKKVVEESVESGCFSDIQLCRRYPRLLKWGVLGHVKRINLKRLNLNGHLKLSKIHETVTDLRVSFNDLDSIGDLEDLRGSSVRYLDVKRNGKLRLNLAALENHDDPLPLNVLVVSINQISGYLRFRQMTADQWTQISTLRKLHIWNGRSRRHQRLAKQREASGSDSESSADNLIYRKRGEVNWPQIPNSESRNVFESLKAMISGVESKDIRFVEPMEFIMESLGSGECSVRDLCHRFGKTFGCDEEGHLIRIYWKGYAMTGSIDLSQIPSTVQTLNVARNHLSGFGDLKDLEGSQLQILSIERNADLAFDLGILEDHKDPICLQKLTISTSQMCRYLGIECANRGRNEQIKQWAGTSTLKVLSVGSYRGLYPTDYLIDDTHKMM